MFSFDDLVGAATSTSDHDPLVPYEYQRQIADDGFPSVINAPTGAGKTVAAVLPWLWRRRFHPSAEVRTATPRWLVVCLPMRVLVEQVVDTTTTWLANIAAALPGTPLPVHVVMAGETATAGAWRRDPGADAIFVGTLDMLISRALNRGYGMGRYAWPIDFGLFNNGCHWVFDEIQLMGPALPTSRQLDAFRQHLGTAMTCTSTWMSATVDTKALQTVDNPKVGRTLGPSDSDVAGPLRQRLEASKTIQEIALDPRRRAPSLASKLLQAHRPGTLTLAMLNTVDQAVATFRSLTSQHPAAEVSLLHSRFRPHDRQRAVDAALAPLNPDGPGRIVVSTQVLEAGVDISAATMFTEAAPWPSLVQRAGRCNRDGLAPGAMLLWAPPAKPLPYPQADIDAAVRELRQLEGVAVTPQTVRRNLPLSDDNPAVLRRKDLVALFDTGPDLSGNDIDVSIFIRARDQIDVSVGWRLLAGHDPDRGQGPLTNPELCPVPLGQLRDDLLGGHRVAWKHEPRRGSGAWVRCDPRELAPGMIVVLDAQTGGYSAQIGWDPASRDPVPVAPTGAPSALPTLDDSVGSDEISGDSGWMDICTHLAEVEDAASAILAQLAPPGITPAMNHAAVTAARLHDIGKGFHVFQDTMLRACADDEERAQREAVGPWAKCPDQRLRHSRPHFRHELVSALALLGEGACMLEALEEKNLAVYLVAAHHGRVRLAIRSLGDEPDFCPEAPRRILGVAEGEVLPPVEAPGGAVPGCTLSLAVMELGEQPGGVPSWTQLATGLRDRPDLGIFRLGFLESLVRLADWQASGAHRGPAR